MTRSKISYLDETLKRLPIIGMIAAGAWWGISKLNVIESKIEKIEILSFKDKEIIYSRFAIVEAAVNENEAKNNEQDKQLFRLAAVLPTKKEDE
jgi:Pyruvate/2-oxoacid:ferredoxin oxidoreductase gamma subunit